MSVLHPVLLYLLPAAALPVLLHLFAMHRLRTVELSTFRFLRDTYVVQRRRLRLLDALLAALRAFFLLALVLAACRPVVRHWAGLWPVGPAGGAVVLVDSSASMNALAGGLPALERARSAARSVAAKLPAGDRLTVVRVADKPETVFDGLAGDREGVAAAADSLRLTPGHGNFSAAFQEIFGARARPAGGVLYVVTDRQKGDWREVAVQGLGRVVVPGTSVIVLDVGSRDSVGNVAVVGDPPADRAVVGLPMTLTARVVNYSSEPVAVSVGVFVDDREVGRWAAALGPGGSAAKPVAYSPAEPGLHRGRFEVTTRPTDRFPDDDRFDFALAVEPRLPVLLVTGRRGANVDAGLYLRAALTAGASPAVELREVPEGRLDPQALADVDAVVLADCGDLGPTHLGWLGTYVAGGGGLVVFPGDRAGAASGGLRAGAASAWLPATIGEADGEPDGPATGWTLEEVDLTHSALSVFADDRRGRLKGVRLDRRFALTPVAGREAGRVLLRLSDGAPALIEGKSGRGKVLLMAFAAEPRWTNLPLRPEFVPLVLQLVRHAARRGMPTLSGAVAAGAVAHITIPETWGAVSGSVTSPAGRTTPLAFARSAHGQVAVFEPAAERGFHQVAAGQPSDPVRSWRAEFAVNIAPEESDFAAVSEAELRSFFPGADVRVVDVSAEAQQEYGPPGGERELSGALVWLLFAVIGAEFLLATVSGGRPAGERRRVRAGWLRPTRWLGGEE